MSPDILPITPATLLRSEPWPHSTEFLVSKLRFRGFLQHSRHQPDDETLDIVAHMVYAEASPESRPATAPRPGGDDWISRVTADHGLRARPILLYLCGGPGADNPPCRVPEMNRWLLQKGYSILYVDYRGCGESSPVRSRTLTQRCVGSDAKRAHFISLFCQDNIVRDLEAIRHCLAKIVSPSTHIKWTILGQSYGGYISLTYLSMYPEGLEEVFITGGLPPCGMNINDYFRIEYKDIVAQNKAWYAAYPDADSLVRRLLYLVTSIGPKNIQMTGRGYMTSQKLLTLGRQFGSKVGFSEVYQLLCEIDEDLTTNRRLSAKTINKFEGILHVDERPLYPILLEQTWCSGGKTGWAAERIAREIPGFEYLQTDTDGNYPDPWLTPTDQPIYFTANAYCRFHFDTHEELIDLKSTVEILAEHEWDCPYDFDKLSANPLNVPVYAISFEKDMHLDVGVAAKTAGMVGGLRLVIDPGWHQDIRYKPAEVLENLFRVRDKAQQERNSRS